MTILLILFKPATSTIEGTSVISLLPIYSDKSFVANVLTQSLGTPKGSFFIAVRAIKVPPPPPIPIMACASFSCSICCAILAAPLPIICMALPLSFLSLIASKELPPARATSSAEK